jgi:hypothetical protein
MDEDVEMELVAIVTAASGNDEGNGEGELGANVVVKWMQKTKRWVTVGNNGTVICQPTNTLQPLLKKQQYRKTNSLPVTQTIQYPASTINTDKGSHDGNRCHTMKVFHSST